MRFSGFFNILLIGLLPGLTQKVQAQGYTGSVKNEKGLITITSSGFTNAEALAAAWKIPVKEILDENPGLQNGNFTGLVDIQIPVASILKPAACEGCSAVYHRVQQSEGLFRIGRWYGNIPVSVLKERNNLRSDYLKPGQQLLIGYVEVPKISFAEPVVVSADTPAVAPSVQPEIQNTSADSTNKVLVNPPVVRELSYKGTGVFEEEFKKSENPAARKSGKAAIFKSESGWADGRFYILCGHLKTGVVVKVFHAKSGKTIYAKVVGPLPDIKQNEGLDWRLNSAGAAALGIIRDDEVFDIELEY